MIRSLIITIIAITLIATAGITAHAATMFSGNVVDADIDIDWNSTSLFPTDDGLQNTRYALQLRSVGASGCLTLSDGNTLHAILNLQSPVHPLTTSMRSGFTLTNNHSYSSYASGADYLGKTLISEIAMSTDYRPPSTCIIVSGSGDLRTRSMMLTSLKPQDDSTYTNYMRDNPTVSAKSLAISGQFADIEYTHSYPAIPSPTRTNQNTDEIFVDMNTCGIFNR